MNLNNTTDLARVFGDITRLRLLTILSREELTVAELVEVTKLPQSRVSTHLGKLRECDLVRDRREGGSSYYVFNREGLSTAASQLWASVTGSLEDPLLDADRDNAKALVASRKGGGTWADSVAGQMSRHYSPGRTWEAAARSLVGLIKVGDVLDIASGDGALAELIAPCASSVTCLDVSERIVAKGQERLAHLSNLRFFQGDMQQLEFEDQSFDAVLLMGALSYASDPKTVLLEAIRVLRVDGWLVGTVLSTHNFGTAVRRYNHVNHGVSVTWLREMLESCGLKVHLCAVTSAERRVPNFEIITMRAQRVSPN